ncbi:MAG: hypothetical protein ISS58_08655 [Dehalococcoidales bacterium]|nr:hypothetical protein [Dehalococcoidales bacterium]
MFWRKKKIEAATVEVSTAGTGTATAGTAAVAGAAATPAVTKKVELEEKKVMPKVTIYTEKEIRQKIEALTEKENKTHFYLSSSPVSGGPLGRGAALVELNPNCPAKGQKKYILTAVSVNETEPAGKGMRMFDSNDPKHVARWIKERHFQYTKTR